MRTIELASAFKRDYRRAKAAPRHAKDIDALLSNIVSALVADMALPAHNRDHELSGN